MKVLIIDANNAFIRARIVDPSLTLDGNPIGGLTGFLKIMQKVVKDHKPDKIIICWDGASGSKKRKLILPEYKEGRKPARLNKREPLPGDEEGRNNLWQQEKLINLLNDLPVYQFIHEMTEADDIIAFIRNYFRNKDDEVIILSNDKDFYQLIDQKTSILTTVKKERQIINEDEFKNLFGYFPVNFALAKAIAGDHSDNIAGIGGISIDGIKNKIKLFEDAGEEHILIEDLLTFAKNEMKPSSLKNKILSSEKLIKMNYHLVQLFSPSISPQFKFEIEQALEQPSKMNLMRVKTSLIKDGLFSMNLNELFHHMENIAG